MDNEFLTEKLEKMSERLSDLNATMTAIKIDLAYHIRRTELLEHQFSKLDKDITKFRGFFTIGGWLVAVIATVITVLNMLHLI